jgi:hypothetical protein
MQAPRGSLAQNASRKGSDALPKTETARIAADRLVFLVEPWGIEP